MQHLIVGREKKHELVTVRQYEERKRISYIHIRGLISVTNKAPSDMVVGLMQFSKNLKHTTVLTSTGPSQSQTPDSS